MSAPNRTLSRVLLVVVTLAVGWSLASTASAASCTGTRFDYYESPAFLEIVGSKVSCSGFPDQTDSDADGNHVETPFFTTETAWCPCGGGGGGGGGGGDDGGPGGESEGE